MTRITWVLAALCLGCPWTGCSGETPPGELPRAPAAPAPSLEDAVRQRLDELLAHSARGEIAAAAKYVLYRGPDESRDMKDVCDFSKERDRALVESAFRRIGAAVRSGPLTPRGFRREKESEGEWLVLGYRAGEKDVDFVFLAVKGTYALGDVD